MEKYQDELLRINKSLTDLAEAVEKRFGLTKGNKYLVRTNDGEETPYFYDAWEFDAHNFRGWEVSIWFRFRRMKKDGMPSCVKDFFRIKDIDTIIRG